MWPQNGRSHRQEFLVSLKHITLHLAFLHDDNIMNTFQTMSTLLATDVHTGYISAWMESSIHSHKLAHSSVTDFNSSCLRAKIPALYRIKATAQVSMAMMILWPFRAERSTRRTCHLYSCRIFVFILQLSIFYFLVFLLSTQPTRQKGRRQQCIQ